jgi:Dehydrogenases with different specificities (related to short-chain alcohol dehydrogenases)
MFDLKGKVALVTGAGRGIGKEIALTLAFQGADVIVTDVADTVFDTAKEIEKLGVNSLALKCDVSNSQEVQNTQKQVIEKFKKLDILVNNAGIYPQKPFLELTQEDWAKVLDINLNGIFYVTKAFLPGMVERKYGKIVNLSSISGPFVIFPNLVHYSSSKAAIAGFTKALALEMAPNHINVNAVAPGPIDVSGGQMPEAMTSQIIRAIPLGRMGKPDDIASLVVFLVSDEANFITGQTVVSDGGYVLP